jgi:NDP-sugar pyrophosphorylase family protein
LSDYVGIILAAGQGKRMGALGEHYPKALLPVANEPIVGHHLRLLRDLGIEEVYVVVGYRSTDLVRVLRDGESYGIKIKYVEQGQPLGSAHALGRLRPHVRQPFLLILGDYYFSVTNPKRMLDRLRDGNGSAILAKRENDARLVSEACELHIDPEGKVLKIVEKPARPTTNLKGCGFYALQPEIFDAIAKTPRTALRDEYELSTALDIYVKSGNGLYAEEDMIWDFNFTRAEDLLECNLKWLRQEGRNELIARQTHIESQARLENVVVGDHAEVRGSLSLKNVVVFSDARIEGANTIERALVTPHGVFFLG